jgi:hypothetical protein
LREGGRRRRPQPRENLDEHREGGARGGGGGGGRRQRNPINALSPSADVRARGAGVARWTGPRGARLVVHGRGPAAARGPPTVVVRVQLPLDWGVCYLSCRSDLCRSGPSRSGSGAMGVACAASAEAKATPPPSSLLCPGVCLVGERKNFLKQCQFSKLPPQPCVKSRDKSNEVFDRMLL